MQLSCQLGRSLKLHIRHRYCNRKWLRDSQLSTKSPAYESVAYISPYGESSWGSVAVVIVGGNMILLGDLQNSYVTGGLLWMYTII